MNFSWDEKQVGYPAKLFVVLRIYLGIYSFLLFAHLLPFARELFSYEGVFTERLEWAYFPSIFFINDSPLFIEFGIVVLILLSVLLILGIHRRLVLLTMWYLMASLFAKNTFSLHLAVTYIAYYYLAFAFVPLGEGVQFNFKDKKFNKVKKEWFMPKPLYWIFSATLCVQYFSSGITKFYLPIWQNGDAVENVVSNIKGYDYFLVNIFLSLPTFILKISTWWVGLSQLLFLPLFIFKPTRPWIWLMCSFSHATVIFLIELYEVAFAILLFHLLIFNTEWLIEYKKLIKLLKSYFTKKLRPR